MFFHGGVIGSDAWTRDPDTDGENGSTFGRPDPETRFRVRAPDH
jgi:hypothetical protein